MHWAGVELDPPGRGRQRTSLTNSLKETVWVSTSRCSKCGRDGPEEDRGGRGMVSDRSVKKNSLLQVH